MIGQRLVCENVPSMQARSAPHDWLTLTAIDTAHLRKSGRLHFISVSLDYSQQATREEMLSDRMLITERISK